MLPAKKREPIDSHFFSFTNIYEDMASVLGKNLQIVVLCNILYYMRISRFHD